jgi:hypothetical protein
MIGSPSESKSTKSTWRQHRPTVDSFQYYGDVDRQYSRLGLEFGIYVLETVHMKTRHQGFASANRRHRRRSAMNLSGHHQLP